MLGADEFAFGTSMLVSLGCVQCRRCNMNCCPVGIATQQAELRKNFAGRPEHLQRYFRFLAEEVREVLSALSLKSLDEAHGRTDLLKSKEGSPFDFSDVLAFAQGREELRPAAPKGNYDARELIPAVERGETAIERKIANCDRSVGAAISGWLVENGDKAPVRIAVRFTGTAGQSFGAFLHGKLAFHLDGEANDYVGKSLSGGSISISGDVGNVIAYGATSGSLFIRGTAGERFGIRNSGATLVVEGTGDHGCEYMTGGTAVILGPVGVNFAAGMTGGVAYVYDEAAVLDLNCNLDSVDLFPVAEGSNDEKALLALLKEHVARTGSEKARCILGRWEDARPAFAKVEPVRDLPHSKETRQ
jgi:glutamate synthase (NADPH/NADH) large chain